MISLFFISLSASAETTMSNLPPAIQGQPVVIQGLAVPQPVQIIAVPDEMMQEVPPSNGDSARARAVRGRGGTPGRSSCDGAMIIANTNGRCQSLEYDRDMLACARQAGRAAFGFQPTRFVFNTGEGQVSSGRRCLGGRKASTHSAGRALDIFSVDIYNGSAVSEVSFHERYLDRRGHRTFYHGFRDCWREAVVRARGSLAGTSGSGCLDYSHAGHHDHMHISLPPTNANRRQYNMCST
ncbi:MAG: hypothetical protein HRT44_02555 [Bdellovibrionales bacterium]|nr:hypothetical protein [Bdellovibrionales bacterium]NQZ18129.1 hypothetical protein [Bdellovibrionales bacterium]